LVPIMTGMTAVPHGDTPADPSGATVTRGDVEAFLRTHQVSDARIGKTDRTAPASVDRFDCRPWAVMRAALAPVVAGRGDRYLDAVRDDDPVCLARLRGGFIFGQIAGAPPQTCETGGLFVHGRTGSILKQFVCSSYLDVARLP
jgi:hypothetical protein